MRNQPKEISTQKPVQNIPHQVGDILLSDEHQAPALENLCNIFLVLNSLVVLAQQLI